MEPPGRPTALGATGNRVPRTDSLNSHKPSAEKTKANMSVHQPTLNRSKANRVPRTDSHNSHKPSAVDTKANMSVPQPTTTKK